MNHNRQSVLIGVGVLLLLGAFGCLWLVVSIQSPTPRETGLLGLLLTLLSMLGSWAISHVYSTSSSRESAQGKIDTIAQQSSEKILNHSTQLWRLEQYFRSSLQCASEEDNDAAVATLRNRIDSACEMARMLRSSNNTFLSDWQGVVSDSVNAVISSQASKVREIMDAYDQLDTPPSGDTEQWKNLRDELVDKVSLLRAQLPSAVTPDRKYHSAPAVAVVQHSAEASPTRQTGQLIVELLRPVYNATGSGKFKPPLVSAPTSLNATLIEKPEGSPKIEVHAGGGTTFDFNVHFKSMTFGTDMLIGKYVVEYEGTTETGETDGAGVPDL